MIQIGERAPDFSGTATDGTALGLARFRGRSHVVLFFYPKDFTPG
jgi:peroxiredoxin Q/BCP